jgi:hypothetical protein
MHACRSLSDGASMTMHLFSLGLQLQCVLCSSRAQYVSLQPGMASPVICQHVFVHLHHTTVQ